MCCVIFIQMPMFIFFCETKTLLFYYHFLLDHIWYSYSLAWIWASHLISITLKMLEEYLCTSFRGCHATSPLTSVFFTRKFEWQPLIELHSWAEDILSPTSRAKKWGIICLCSLCGCLSNPLQREIAKEVGED